MMLDLLSCYIKRLRASSNLDDAISLSYGSIVPEGYPITFASSMNDVSRESSMIMTSSNSSHEQNI